MADTPNATPTNYNSAYTGPEIDAAVGAVLTKEGDWDVAASGKLPAGGEVGQILEKTGVENYAAGWRTPPFLVRPNLLDNWYFVGGGSASGETFPINQRGQSSYGLSYGGYGIDRWKSGVNIANVALGDDGITLTSDIYSGSLRQVLSTPFPLLAGKKVTYSILYDGGFATGSGTVPTSGDTSVNIVTLNKDIPNGDFCRFRLYGGTAPILQAEFGQTARNSLKVKAIKLEIGDTQTLAHQENGAWILNELPDPTAELAKCKRYYQRLEQTGASIGYVIANVMAYNAGNCNLTLPLGMHPASGNSVTVTYSNISDIVLATTRIEQGIEADHINSARVTNSGAVVMNLGKTDALTAGTVYNAALKANGAWLAFSTEP